MLWVIDASEALKWRLDDLGHQAARDFLREMVPEAQVGPGETIRHAGFMVAPALLLIEVGEVLRKRFNGAPLGSARNSLALALHEFPPDLRRWIAIEPVDETLADQALVLAQRARSPLAIHHSVPDAVYVALAAKWQGTLVTCDQRQANLAVACGIAVRRM